MPPKGPQTSSRPFRILALPLARLPRPPNSASPSTSTPKPKTPLLFFQVLQPESSPDEGPPSIPTRALNKASDTWLKLGEKPKDSWMYWFYSKGEGLMDRIEYEEWALKAIIEDQGLRIAKEGELQEVVEVPLLKPQLQGEPLPPLLPKLHRLLLHRIPYHRNMMVRSLAFTPVTFPFALIPILPNFPLFYVLWRAWSHFKAWRGATYLESLLKLGFIVEKPSPELDEVYRSTGVAAGERGSQDHAPDQTSSEGVTRGEVSEKGRVQEGGRTEGIKEMPDQAKGKGPAPDGTTTPQSMIYQANMSQTTSHTESSSTSRHPSMLIGLNQAKLVAKAFGLKPNEVMDLNRAVEQADGRARVSDNASAVPGASAGGEGKEKPATEWRGNLHR